MAELTYTQVSELINCNTETGEIWYKERHLSLFPTEMPGRLWNAKHSGRRCFLNVSSDGYFYGDLFDNHYKAHRIVWMMHYKKWPQGDVDHINGDKQDNRIENLRDVSRSVNSRNKVKHSRNTSGFNGVCFHKKTGKWRAYVTIDKKQQSLGLFNAFESAVSARIAANEFYGFTERHGK